MSSGKSMVTSPNGNIFRVTGHLCGEFTGPRWIPTQRPVTRSFDVYFDLRPNKRLSKQSWGWWFETPLCPLWRHRNGQPFYLSLNVLKVWASLLVFLCMQCCIIVCCVIAGPNSSWSCMCLYSQVFMVLPVGRTIRWTEYIWHVYTMSEAGKEFTE